MYIFSYCLLRRKKEQENILQIRFETGPCLSDRHDSYKDMNLSVSDLSHNLNYQEQIIKKLLLLLNLFFISAKWRHKRLRLRLHKFWSRMVLPPNYNSVRLVVRHVMHSGWIYCEYSSISKQLNLALNSIHVSSILLNTVCTSI